MPLSLSGVETISVISTNWWTAYDILRSITSYEKEGARTAIELDRGQAGSRYRKEWDSVHTFPFRFGYPWFSFFFRGMFYEWSSLKRIHAAHCRMANATIIIIMYVSPNNNTSINNRAGERWWKWSSQQRRAGNGSALAVSASKQEATPARRGGTRWVSVHVNTVVSRMHAIWVFEIIVSQTGYCSLEKDSCAGCDGPCG